MAISMNCPNCMAQFHLDEELLGKKVKCQKCAAVFTVSQPSAPEPTAPAALTPEEESIVPKLELDDPPAAPTPGTEVSSTPLPKTPAWGDDDEEKDRDRKEPPKPPPARKRSDPSRGPRRDAPEKSGSGMMVVVLLLVGVGLLSCLGCVGVGAVWFVMERHHDGGFDNPPRVNPPIAVADKRDGFVKDGVNNKGQAPAVNVDFGVNGVFTANHRIEFTDQPAPIGLFNHKRHRVYLAQMEAGQTYQIDMSADFFFDAYLYVMENNNILVQDDDGGGNHNARIVFRPTRTGQYRIIATSLGGNATGPFTLTVRRNDPSKDPAMNPPLFALNDLSYRVYTYKFNETPVADAVWARDGKHFFILGRTGLLQRVNAETGKTEKMTLLEGQFNDSAIMQMSSAGLVVATPMENRVRVYDPNNPAVVKKNLFVQNVRRLTSGPGASVAVVQVFEFGATNLRVLDLERGIVGLPIRWNTASPWITLSPDGKFLFHTDAGKLQRHRINGLTLAFEESSPQVVQFGDGIHVSADSQFVCLSGPPTFAQPFGHPTRGLYVYPAAALQKPAVTITGNQPRHVGIDPKAGWFLGTDSIRALVLYKQDGIYFSQPSIPGVFAFSVRGVTVSPLGGEALLRTGDRVAYLRLKNKNSPIVKIDAPPAKKEDRSVVGTVTRTGGFMFKNLNLRPIGGFGSLGADPCWDAQGKYLFHIDSGTTLMKINTDFKVESSTDLGQTCRYQALSAEGLVVIPSNVTELWLYDAQTLARRKTITLQQTASRLASAPNTPYAFVAAPNLMRVDLKAGTVNAAQVEGKPFGFQGVKNIAVSPDGKYLFLQASDFWLHRIRIDGARLVHESAKEPIVRSTASFAISQDSKQMAVCYLTALKGSAAKLTQTNIYAIDNWGVPAYTLQMRIRSIAFADGGAIFADVLKGGVRHYPNPAKAEFNYNSWSPISLGRRIIGRPGSNGCLVLTTGSTQWVEPIPKN
ncbi:MAG: hypothetical protein HYX68_14405 [Planctomycetes bacterium]|nr:hypothetical protein [Planctomycetota bacterium]